MSDKKMTRADALAEAKRRWDPTPDFPERYGGVWVKWCTVRTLGNPKDVTRAYQVGDTGPGSFGMGTRQRGSGDSWEAAFAAADRRSEGA